MRFLKVLLVLFVVFVSVAISSPQSEPRQVKPFSIQQRNSGGLGISEIVTPEPNLNEGSNPVIPEKNNDETAEECTCVSYYLCDPVNNKFRGEEEVFDGFGVIDIRFNENDCPQSLDVCCKGVNQKEEPIVPPPPPSRGGGCGIRNVGGLDFQLADNTVIKSNLLFHIHNVQCVDIYVFYCNRITNLALGNSLGP